MKIKEFFIDIGEVKTLKDVAATAGLGFEGLAKAIGLSTAALGTFLGVAAGVFILIKIIDAVVVTFNELKEKAEKSRQEYQAVRSEIENLNSQLETTRSRINELKAQGSLTLVEQEELTRLEAENNQLERQLELKEQIAQYSQSEAAQDANDVLTDKRFTLYDQVRRTDNEGYTYTDVIYTGQGDIIDYTEQLIKEVQDARDEYTEALKNGAEQATLDAINQKITTKEKEIVDSLKTIEENRESLIDDVTGNVISGYEDTINRIDVLSRHSKTALDEAYESQQKIDNLLSRPTLQNAVEQAKELASSQNGITLDDIISQFPELASAAENAGIEIQDVIDTINAMVGTVNFDEIKNQLRTAFISDEKDWHIAESMLNEWNEFVGQLSEDDIKILYDIYNTTDTIGWSIEDWVSALQNAKKEADEVGAVFSETQKNFTNLVAGISAVQSALDSQSTGKSISLDTFNSDKLKDYASALEYVNGTYQLNADKVNEIIKVKAQEQIEINNTNKALKQSQYLENAGQIEKLRQKIIDKNFAEGESAESIQANIDALLAENGAIRDIISQYDLMSSSLIEATGAYQNWLNAQNASQSGEMFDSSLSALQKINDTLNKTDSDSYGRIGNQDFKAAIDFVIPDSIDSSDETAVNNYLKSLSDIFTLDDNGNFDGLNIEAFCRKAVEKGLMVLEDGEFKIAGKTTMQDFADGMNLSLPLVQAIFGEIEEFGGEFSWADEAIKTVGDLGVAAYEAAESLRDIEGNEDIKVVLDVSEFTDKQSALDTLDATIQEMNDLKAKPNVDASEIEYANTIIQYAVAQKQMLDAPAVLSVDTSQVTGELGDALSLLQKFQETKNTIEMQAAVGADTSEAQAKLDSLTSEIQNLSPEMKATLAIDTSSTESIQSYINGLDAEAIVSFGVDSSLVDAYQEAEHNSTGEVKWDNNTSAVDRYSSSTKNAFGIVNWRNDTTSVKIMVKHL